MKAHITAAALILATAPVFGQATGVANPDPTPITADAPAKPSPAIPADSTRRPLTTPTAPAQETYGTYVPYRGAASSAATPSTDLANPDAEIVTTVEDPAGEVREGTLLKARLQQNLTTVSTTPGTRFTATLTEDIAKNGRVILPAGSTINGQVTEVHSGRRITGAATLHLEPRSVTLPDGSQYIIHAQLIDLGDNSHSRVNNEGTLIRRDHAKETLGIVSGTTGAAATAGALAAGPVGAAVGAGIGAGVSTVVWLKQNRQETLPKDSMLIFSLTLPMPLKPLAPPTNMSSLQPTAPAAAQ